MHHENKHIFLHGIEYFNHHWQVYAMFLVFTLFGAGFNISNHPVHIASSIITAKKSDSSPLQMMSAKMSGLSMAGGGKGLQREMLVFKSHTFFLKLATILRQAPNSDSIIKHVANGSKQLFNINYFIRKAQSVFSNSVAEENFEVAAGSFDRNLRSVISIYAKNSFLIQFSSKTSDPEISVQVTNAVVELAIQEIGNRDVKELEEGRSFLKLQLAGVSGRITTLEDDIVTNTKKARTLSMEQIEGEIGEKNIGLHRQLVEFKVKIKHNERQIAELLKNKDLGATPGVFLDTEAKNYAKFGYSSKIFRLRKEIEHYRARVATIRPMVAQYAKRQENLPKIEQFLFSVKKKLAIEYVTFNQLNNQIMNIKMQDMSIRSRVTVVEPALLSEVVPFMSQSFQVGMAILIAIASATLLIFVLETLDPNVKNQAELEALGMVYMGAITDFASKRSWSRLKKFFRGRLRPSSRRSQVTVDHRSAESICFRYLRSRILYQRQKAGQKNKVLVFVSPQSGEGKTFLSFNLSKTISMAKKKILVVDCDFLKGSLSSGYGFSKENGVTNYLVSNSSTPEDIRPIIQRITGGLDFLPSGTQAEESLESFCDKKFGELIDFLRPNYDYIIIDTPGILPVAEAVDIIKFGDLVLMCLVRGRSQMEYVKRAIERILHVTDSPMGFIFNRFSDYHKSDYSYYYGRKSYKNQEVVDIGQKEDSAEDIDRSA